MVATADRFFSLGAPNIEFSGDIVGDRRSPLPYGASDDPLPAGHVGARGGLRAGNMLIRLDPRPGNWRNIQRYRIELTDPCHSEAAMLHRNAARLVEQLLALANMYYQRVDSAY